MVKTDGKLMLDDCLLIMPLTTGLKVSSIEDLIGFLVTRPFEEDVATYTLEGKTWEITAEYTGLTAETYRENIAEPEKVITVLKDAPAVFSYSGRIATDSLTVLGVDTPVIELPCLYRLSMMADPIFDDTQISRLAAINFINSKLPPRFMKREEWLTVYGLDFEENPKYDVGTRNVKIDSTILQHIL